MRSFSLGSVIRAGAWGVVVGGAAGFTLGVLLAPEEGQTIRRRLLYQLEHIAGQVGVFVEHVFNPESASDARRTGDALVADAQQRAEQIRTDIDALLGEMRRQSSSR